MTEIAVVPRIRYPRDACVGVTYLMTVDLDHSIHPDDWPYDNEEYAVTCFLEAGSLFEQAPVGDRTIVVHRFGGSYGPAVFRLRAQRAARGVIRVILVDRVGVPVAVIALDDIQVRTERAPRVVPGDDRAVEIANLVGEGAPLEKPVSTVNRGPRGRALLVGPGGELLRGTDHDLRRMASALRARDFVVDVHAGEHATRQGILDGYHALIAGVQPDQAAVFYYTGHSFRATPPGESRPFQGICPTDISESTSDDFRGITAWELSILTAKLTHRTRNVTLIFDCAYASQMSQGGVVHDTAAPVPAAGAIPRALPHPVRLGFDAHFEALRSLYGVTFGSLDPGGNRDAVRLVACQVDECAYEFPVADGEYGGAFTNALLDVLDELGAVPISWMAIASAIRERVHERFLVQTPGVEGPARRLLFSLNEEVPGGGVTIAEVKGGFQLGAGRLMGVRPGDVYAVMPAGSVAYRSADAIAELEVVETSATLAAAVLARWTGDHAQLPPDAIAIPVQQAAVRWPVQIDVRAPAQHAVQAEIDATSTLRLAGPDEPSALPILRLVDDELVLEGSIGPLFASWRYPQQLRSAVDKLVRYAAAQQLRELEGEHGVLAGELEIEWGTVVRGEMRPMAEAGGALTLRDRVYVRVRITTTRPLYVHIFNVGIRGQITLLTGNFAPSGYWLTPDVPEFTLGRAVDGSLRGLPLAWPDDVPRTSARIDDVIFIVTAAPADLRCLETVDHRPPVRGSSSKLEDLLLQSLTGQRRELRDIDLLDGFLIKRLWYRLDPQDAVTVEAPPPQRAEPEAARRDPSDDRAQLRRERPPRGDLDFGFVIGIEHYRHLGSLLGVALDAREFYNWLCTSDGARLDPGCVRTVLSVSEDSAHQQAEIDHALLELLHAAHARGGGRRLYFYFIGRGGISPGPPDDAVLLLSHWSRDLLRLALDSQAYLSMLCGTGLFDEVVAFIDCLHVPMPVIGVPPTFTQVWEPAPRQTRLFVAATRDARYPAFESPTPAPLPHGTFTRCLLSVLRRSGPLSPGNLKMRLEHDFERWTLAMGLRQRVSVTNALLEGSGFGSRGKPKPLQLRFVQRQGRVTLRESEGKLVARHRAGKKPWQLSLPTGLYWLEGGGQDPLLIMHDGRGTPHEV